MNRRWQKEGKGRYETLVSYGSFTASLPALGANSLKLCDAADMYATYSTLHAKGRSPKVSAQAEGGFHFFWVEATQPKVTMAAAAAAAATATATDGKQPEDAAAEKQSTVEGASDCAMPMDSEPGACEAPEAAAAAAGQLTSVLFTADGKRLEPVVPVSSKHPGLGLDTMQRLFHLGGGLVARHILLAIVDDDGSVSLLRTFNYIQPPFEGPETLPSVDAMEAKEDSDQD